MPSIEGFDPALISPWFQPQGNPARRDFISLGHRALSHPQSWRNNWYIVFPYTNPANERSRFDWSQKHLFGSSYPVLGPYYPISTPAVPWQQDLSGGYYGYWWP